MNLFEETDYRKILRRLLEEKKAVDPRYTFEFLAARLRIQKAYVSKVIRGRADFNTDQLYLACEFFGLNKEEQEYLQLLLEFARTGLKARKDTLRKRISELQHAQLQSAKHLRAEALNEKDAADYYLDPIHQLVHVCLGIERYQLKPRTLAEDLGIPAPRVERAISRLEKMGIIQRSQGRLQVLIRTVHLPPDAAVYETWREQLKLLALQRIRNLGRERAYTFSATFTGDEDARARIHARFLDLLKEIQPMATGAPADNAYQISFDLFSWTGSNSDGP